MISRANKLIYPAGIPAKVNPFHPAAPTTRVAFVALGKNFVNIRNGKNGTISGSNISQKFVRGIPCVDNANDFASQVLFTGVSPTSVDANQTLAVIGYANNAANNCRFIASSTQSGGGLLQTATTLKLLATSGAVTADSGISLASNTPYLLVASAQSGGTVNFLVVDLTTGNARTASVSPGPTFSAQNGNIPLLNSGQGDGTNGGASHVFFSGCFLSIPQLMGWAADPWSYWYNSIQNLVGTAVAGFSPWWANNNNSPVLGTGTY